MHLSSLLQQHQIDQCSRLSNVLLLLECEDVVIIYTPFTLSCGTDLRKNRALIVG